jgi:hypothetical protein
MRNLTAVRFEKAMTSGRTRPLVLACEEADEESDGSTEYIVKLRGSIDTGGVGLACELVASEVARYLDLSVPEPAIVEVTEEFARSVPEESSREALRKSLGLNFGSRFLSGGYITWPKGKLVLPALRPVASETIAFDAFIQNPDRTAQRPNLLWKDEELVLFDHEMAFSFLYAIGGPAEPWTDSFEGPLRSHVFYQPLRSLLAPLDRFRGAVEALADERIHAMIQAVPLEWRMGSDGEGRLARIGEYLARRRDGIGTLIEQVRRVMS